MTYRNSAKSALVRAKSELDSDDDQRLHYAALELRMALEALIYDKATLYTEELSNKKLSTWQPKVLLSLLLEIDPYADQNSKLSFGVETEYGQPATEMKLLGEEQVLSLKDIKKYYDKLGSYLHTPTLEQTSSGKISSPEKIRKNCLEVYGILEKVISSRVFNSNFKVTASLNCYKCEAKIVRRIPPTINSVIAECIECSATYELTRISGKEVLWKPIRNEFKCANSSCNETIELWKNEFKLGAYWKCVACNGHNEISLGISYTPSEIKA